MNDKVIKGIAAIVTGSVLFKVGVELRKRKVQKELEEVIEHESQDEE